MRNGKEARDPAQDRSERAHRGQQVLTPARALQNLWGTHLRASPRESRERGHVSTSSP